MCPSEGDAIIPPILEMRTPRPKIFHFAMVAQFVNVKSWNLNSPSLILVFITFYLVILGEL